MLRRHPYEDKAGEMDEILKGKRPNDGRAEDFTLIGFYSHSDPLFSPKEDCNSW